MARKSSKTDWREVAEAAKGGDTPYLWRTPEDKWVNLIVDMDTLEKNDSDKHDGGVHEYEWFSISMIHDESDDESIEEEIPFWTRGDFLEAALAWVGDNEIPMKYRRSKDGKNNYGEWKTR